MSKKKEYKDVKTFVVKRSEWLRGTSVDSCLLDKEDKMCCLGFYAQSCGLRKQDIRGISSPQECIAQNNKKWDTFLLKESKDPWSYGMPDSIGFDDSKQCVELMKINDSENISDKEREKELTSLFNKAGIKVKFVD